MPIGSCLEPTGISELEPRRLGHLAPSSLPPGRPGPHRAANLRSGERVPWSKTQGRQKPGRRARWHAEGIFGCQPSGPGVFSVLIDIPPGRRPVSPTDSTSGRRRCISKVMDDLITPALVGADYEAAFDSTWLAGANLGGCDGEGDDVVLDCGTPASDAAIALCNALEIGRVGPGYVPAPYLRIGPQPRDRALVGRHASAVIDGYVEDAMRRWRQYAGPLVSAGSAFFRQYDNKALLATLRRWCTELESPSLPDDAPVPVLAAPLVAPLLPPVPQAMLDSTPTAARLRNELLERWGTARFLAHHGGLAHASQPVPPGDAIRKTLPEHLGSARVQNVASASLRSRALPPLPPPVNVSPEIVYRVVVYHPSLPRRDQEFLVLGSQTLDALRDRIYCVSDLAEAGQGHAAAYLYIEGVIYDDRRPGRDVMPRPTPGESVVAANPARRFLSEEIASWSHNALRCGRSTGWGDLRPGSMAETRFDTLRPRLGAHYLFCHCGSCQHIVVFADVRFLSALPGHDVLDASCYPRHLAQAAVRRRHCGACGRNPARLAVYGDALTADNPTYLCETCNSLLRYNAEGVLNAASAGVTVLPYFHDH